MFIVNNVIFFCSVNAIRELETGSGCRLGRLATQATTTAMETQSVWEMQWWKLFQAQVNQFYVCLLHVKYMLVKVIFFQSKNVVDHFLYVTLQRLLIVLCGYFIHLISYSIHY